jgi:hypothetical protein
MRLAKAFISMFSPLIDGCVWRVKRLIKLDLPLSQWVALTFAHVCLLLLLLFSCSFVVVVFVVVIVVVVWFVVVVWWPLLLLVLLLLLLNGEVEQFYHISSHPIEQKPLLLRDSHLGGHS